MAYRRLALVLLAAAAAALLHVEAFVPLCPRVSPTSSSRQCPAVGGKHVLPWGGKRTGRGTGSVMIMSSAITDDQVMEDLIACPWDQLTEFGNKHYKLLIHPQFYMKLADRIYELPTQEEQDDAAAKATKIWNTLLKMLDAAEEQRMSAATLLEKVLKQAAEEDGSFYVPLSKERSQAMRSEVVKSLDRFDEGLLQTLNSWILKVQDDPDNKDMSSVLQKVFQYYAGQALMRSKGLQRPAGDDTRSPSQVFLRCLLNADPEEWDMLLYNGLKVDVVCSADALVDEVGIMIQLVITQLMEGSLTQRVQAEFLRELMNRVQRYMEESVERSAALGP